MSIESLSDVYADEIKDLWSANDQMVKAVTAMAQKAHDQDLKHTLESSLQGIQQHSTTLKGLLRAADEQVTPAHCKGMEGLVKEAAKHIGADAPGDKDLLDVVILSQYQRMSHYGLAGFGTAAAYAKALGKKDDATKLHAIVKDIYKSDEYASKLAAKVEKMAAHA